jgi:ABC-type lipoprotein release transport system permease subunit
MKNLRLAWKNIWRNKARTLITVAAVFIAVLLSALMSSMQEGQYISMIDNTVKFYSGYLQIHHPDYWEDKSINHTYVPDEDLYSKIQSIEEITAVVPRLEYFTLLSYKDDSRGSLIIGIDPEKENELTNLKHWLKEGEFLTDNDDGILVAVNLAKHLKVNVGDTLVLLSEGYHGYSAAGLFPIRGILEFSSPMMNSMGVYGEISHVQEFFSAPERLTSMALMVNSYDKVKATTKKLAEALGNNYSVMSWEEMQPELIQMIESDRQTAVIFKGLLFVIVGFGIFGTIIMMMAERKRELGVMVAIGMQKTRLMIILLYETILISFVGVVTGFIASLGIIYALKQNPIPMTGEAAKAYEVFGIEPLIKFDFAVWIFANQALTILVLALIIGIFPMIKIANLKVVDALRA